MRVKKVVVEEEEEEEENECGRGGFCDAVAR